MSEMKFVTKKKVTVTCHTPFRIGQIPYSGICRNLTLTIKDISTCLENKAKVVEILSNGKEVPLNFANYDTYNGPSDVDDNSKALTEKPDDPEIEKKNDQGETIAIVNKKKEKEEKKVIKVSTNITPKEEVAVVNTDTKATVEVKEEVKVDTTTEVKADVNNTTDTKVEVENKNHNNNFQQNQKKNKFK